LDLGEGVEECTKEISCSFGVKYEKKAKKISANQAIATVSKKAILSFPNFPMPGLLRKSKRHFTVFRLQLCKDYSYIWDSMRPF
jgi:hypothetical protein